jgi:hypothetical protein
MAFRIIGERDRKNRRGKGIKPKIIAGIVNLKFGFRANPDGRNKSKKPHMLNDRNSRHVRFSRRKTILFSLIIISVIAGALELASYFLITNFAETGTFNARVLQTNYHPFLGWEPPANARVKNEKHWYGKNKFINTDALGRSITPLSYDNPELKIVITGGSTMFGAGSSSNKTTVASLLETKILERMGIQAEVFNLAVRGYNSFQELLSLRQFLLTETADFVLTVSGRNDSQSALWQPDVRSALLPRSVYDNAVDLVRRAETQKTIVLNLSGFLRSKSYFVDLLARAILQGVGKLLASEPVGNFPYKPNYNVIRKRAEITLGNYSAMRALTEFQNGKFYFVLNPTAYTWDNYTFDTPDNTPEKHRISKAFENTYFDSLRELGKSLPVYDLTQIMNGIPGKLYVDNTHFSDEGADILSTHLLNLLSDELVSTKETKSHSGN